VQVDRADGLATFDRRKATLFAQSAQLPLYNDDPVAGNMILLDSYITGFTQGHQILVSGKRARVSISSTSGQNLELVSADGQYKVPFDQLDTYILMAPPPAMTAGTLVWLLKDRNDFVGTLTTDDKIVVMYESARDDDESVGEVVAIQSFEQKVTVHNNQQQEQTLLTLQSSLQNAYDRATVTISANVVAATHGQTVANEVLGSIGMTKASYRYPLKQKPLTYVAADTPSGVQSTLSVQVNQVRWHEVSSLEELASKRHSYLLRRDSQGNTIIYFGTGNRSANLPTGTEQLTATYRIGIGQVGNVPANSLTLLRNRPAGVQRVTNPLAASGGADPDTLDQMRSLAPLQTRTLQRIVSLNDYQTFTQMLGGVGKVQAKSTWDGHRQLVHITVAGVDGAPISRDSALYSELLNAITNATTSQARLVYLDSFEPLYFQIEARLRIDPDYVDSRETVIADATQSLQTAFSFANRDLAQNVPVSEVIALLQNVAGVLAVEMQSLYIKDGQQPVALNPILEAKLARYEGGKLLPAQMLLLQSQNSDGIVLYTEV
jgi:predicted phage baseplate assembly protein